MTDISFDHARLAPYAVKFLATFLRFEFALKEANFGLENGDAQVDWRRVTEKLGVAFFSRIKESGRADTLMKKPPKKQIARNYALEWEQKAPPRTIVDLFEAARRVRNNLVHGGKSGDPEYDADDPRRRISFAKPNGSLNRHYMSCPTCEAILKVAVRRMCLRHSS